MHEATILDAVDKLEASTVAKRAEGLGDIHHILTTPDLSLKLKSIKDAGWHKVLDVLFALVKSDKHDLLGGSATAKKRAANRLETIVAALRLVVGFCGPLIRHKTAQAVLDHVAGHLNFDRDNEAPFRQLVQAEYLKSFHLILGHASHGEHLRASTWRKYVDFTIHAINANLASLGDIEDDDEDAMSFSNGLSMNGSARSTIAVRASQASSQRGPRSRDAQLMDDLVVTLRDLSSITNAPLQTRLGDIAQTVLSTLTTALQTKVEAFQCLNNILVLAQTEEVALILHVSAQVLVIMKRLWTHKVDDKSISLREQMLITLMLVRKSLKPSNRFPETVEASIIESLGKHMFDEYNSRSDRYCLKVSDLLFSWSAADDFFSRRGIQPDLESPSATLNWTTLVIIADLRTLSKQMERSSDAKGSARPKKRQRIATKFPDLVRLLLIDEGDIEFDEVLEFLGTMLASLTDDRAGWSSWVLLVVARLCRLTVARHAELSTFWGRAWSAASHLLPSTTNSRAACFAMVALLESGLLKDTLSALVVTNACFHSGSRGPPSLTDSALILFTNVLQSKMLETERQFADFRDKALLWLDVVWSMPSARDYARCVEIVRMGQTSSLYSLFAALTGGEPVAVRSQLLSVLSPLYQAYSQIRDNAQFRDFLINGTVDEQIEAQEYAKRTATSPVGSALMKRSIEVVVEFLSNKLVDLTNSFHDIEFAECSNKSGKQVDHKRRANLSVEVVEIMCTACAATSLALKNDVLSSLGSELRQAWQCVLDYMLLQSHDNAPFEKCCTRVVRRLIVQPMTDEQRTDFASRRVQYSQSLWDSTSNHGNSQTESNDMDLDFATQPVTSQQQQDRSQASEHPTSRREFTLVTYSTQSFVLAQAELLQDSLEGNRVEGGKFSSAMTSFVLDLPSDDVLGIRKMLFRWLDQPNKLTTSDATRLLHYLAKACIQADNNERNEAALCLVMRTLQSTIDLWIGGEDEELSDVAFDIYSWFINIALGKDIASDQVLLHIVKLLEHLLGRKPRYGTDAQLPSPRTSLLKILKNGSSALRFRIVPSLTKLFESYVLTEHAAIFDDVVDCLPTDPEDEEGIAVRMYILARLGSTWRTVLRQATYHVFETAANVPIATSTARSALRMMGKEAGLGAKPAGLLHLFAPQLFFTWLEEGTIDTMPFTAFEYTSLRELVVVESAELVPQIVLRNNMNHQQKLLNMMDSTWTALVAKHFAKSQVYAIATDIVDHRAGAEVGPVEISMREQLGTDLYVTLAKRHFAEAVAYCILSLSDDRGLDKVFGASSRYKAILQAYDAIRERSSSDTTYPSRQQPCFRAKHLMQILSKLCLTADAEPDSFWTSSLLTFVYRQVLDDAIPALGPLHVASMVRKLRIVVALGGQLAFQGYALEMLLHNLRPFLTKFHCAEDAIGIYWYLLEHGREHLQKDLSFLAGLSVSIFASLSAFATSSQESTTQGSHFKATMSKAQEFRKWLEQFLQSTDTANIGLDRVATFQHIISTAKDISTSGTNHKQQVEGQLLYHIIRDRAAMDPLISLKFFEVIVQALSTDFRLAEDVSDDILVEADEIVAAASILWPMVNSTELSKSFQTWIGTVLGRAYSLKGPKLDLVRPRNLTSQSSDEKTAIEPVHSYREILQCLVNLLWTENTEAASVAEQTLSYILSMMSKSERRSMLAALTDWTNLEDLVFHQAQCPQLQAETIPVMDTSALHDLKTFSSSEEWAASLVRMLLVQADTDRILQGLQAVLQVSNEFGAKILPVVVHLVLEMQTDQVKQPAREALSKVFAEILDGQSEQHQQCARLVLNVILHLRQCVYPREATLARRNSWLDIDFEQAAKTAMVCQMPQAALLLFEIAQSEKSLQALRGRKSLVKDVAADQQLMALIFENVEDDDFFYGSQDQHDISSVMAKWRHEGKGAQVLALQSAWLDSSMKLGGIESALQQRGNDLVATLSMANFHGLACATEQFATLGTAATSSLLNGSSQLNVHQWDLASNNQHDGQSGALISALSKLQTLESQVDMQSALNTGLLDTVRCLAKRKRNVYKDAGYFKDVAALTEVQRLLSVKSSDRLEELWAALLQQQAWETQESFDDVSQLLTTREAAAAAMRRNEKAGQLFHVSTSELLLHEIRSIRASLSIAKEHDASQFCLNRAAYLDSLQTTATAVGLDVNTAITFDIANTLWAQGEITTPIEMLRTLQTSESLGQGVLSIGKAEFLTDLGQKLSQARLDRPDEVTKHYLQPAIEALGQATSGSMAGRVFHNFAAFCDEQLQDVAAKDDFERITKVRNRKLQEINELGDMYTNASGQERSTLKGFFSKAKTWFNLDNEEYKRLKSNREELLQKSLENYLLSMQACDDFSKDVLRLMSLWLASTTIPEANHTVHKYVKSVPTMKLAPFVNQLVSRLLENDKDPFQSVLHDLLYRVCCQHPYHSLYQLFAVCKTKGAQHDPVAKSRHSSANSLAEKIRTRAGTSASSIWVSLHNSSMQFVYFAQERLDKDIKTGTKIPLRKFKYGVKAEQIMQSISQKIPPPTMTIALRADKDYSSLPTLSTFEQQVSVAGGVSAPKIVIVVATDGSRHKMLLKGGNDDLRQDAIMEQVFAQVSDLLQDHRSTRQRNLGIRTYKVVPLTHNAGIIEFVQNTIPLHEYLLPAHSRYYPKDKTSHGCRKAIADATSKSVEQRVKAYQDVTKTFHPVMRFFFMERFVDPDKWFQKRLNYSRSTAAISMLGHVLGLGDRHGHNILLDEQSGEVVHIDLGVAFEAGRVLPVPEVVPFRLTRDLVDGMGISGVDGPFRRCCNFTLEALRKNQDAIMTILDVLRWDPLHSWTTSPLRLQRIQDAQEREAAAAAASRGDDSAPGPLESTGEAAGRKAEAALKVPTNANEPGDADRALATVAKKLSASLSVEATVNELIRQATDERNLAVLYCGWAAYV